MGKLLLWIIVGMLVMLLVRKFGASARAHRQGGAGGARDAAQGTQAPTQDVILGCHVCGVHLPASEALFAHGRVYCCEAHRQQDRGVPEHKTLR